MFMILNAAVISLWIVVLVAFGRCYFRHTKEERAYAKRERTDS